MKYFGFLSFGHYSNGPRHGITAAQSLHQAIDLAVAADEIGVNGAFFRVHHYAPQAAAPMPLLSAIAARTKAIEVGTGVIDMRYENPLYLAEEAAALDLIADGRTALGVSRGAPEIARRGWEAFGYRSEDPRGSDLARAHYERFLDAVAAVPMAEAAPLHEQYPTQLTPGTPLPILPHSEGLRRRIWYGAGSNASAIQAARDGVNLMSSTLVFEHGDKPFGDIQAEQLRAYRRAWAEAGHDWAPRVSVSRSIFPLLSRRDAGLYGLSASGDQVGHLDSAVATFGRTYAADPDTLITQLSQDRALAEADTLLLTIPNQLGFDENWSIIRNFAEHVAPALGWEPARPGQVASGYPIGDAAREAEAD